MSGDDEIEEIKKSLRKVNDLIFDIYCELSENDPDEIERIDFIDEENFDNVINILNNDDLNKISKKGELKKLFNLDMLNEKDLATTKADEDKLKSVKEDVRDILFMMVSGNCKLSSLSDDDTKLEIVFNDTFEDKLNGVASQSFELAELIKNVKSIFDTIYLSKLLKGSSSLSEAYVKIYNKHRDDLTRLKDLIIKIDARLGNDDSNRIYNLIFKDYNSENNNYSNFICNSKSGARHASLEDFNKWLKELLTKKEVSQAAEEIDPDEYEYILKILEDKTYLERISDVNTSSIPHQLNENDLEEILNNAKKYYPNFITNNFVDSINKLFRFKIPYFIGPLARNKDIKNPYSNLVIKEDYKAKKLTPYNFNDAIDFNATKEKFINQRLNTCTYLLGETVLPASSLLYSDYILFNNLNNLKIDGRPIDQDTKARIYNELVNTREKTSLKQIQKFINNNIDNNAIVTGINENDSFNNSSRYKLDKILKENFDYYQDDDVYEDIIKILTIYKDAKSDGVAYLKEKYEKLSDKELRQLESLNFDGWGRLSRELLSKTYSVNKDGEITSDTIIELLKNTTKNFMQIINDEEYNFELAIKSKNNKYLQKYKVDKNINDHINDMLLEMPAVMRRSVKQTIGVVKEIRKATKEDPQKIIIEVTRHDEEKNKQKDSRYKELETYLKSVKKDTKSLEESNQAEYLLNELNALAEQNKLALLKGKHLYLYFKQLGYDMYTGEKITSLEDVLEGKYDLDHIFPKSLKPGDDSLDNLVLVDKQMNQKVKRDFYPIPSAMRENKKVRYIWLKLKEKGLISPIKYARLTREVPLTEDEISSFINRQINALDYSNIKVRDIFNILFPNTKIIFSKSIFPSHMRRVLGIPKIRDLNDTHHAVDAYLNIVTGTLLDDRFGNLRIVKAKEAALKERKVLGEDTKNENPSLNMKNYLNRMVKNFGEKSDDDIEKLTSYDKYLNTTLGNLVFSTCMRHDFLLTYRLSRGDSAFYKQTIFKGGDGALIPLHTSNAMKDTTKYGGYSELKTEYSIIAVEPKKNKKIIVTVPHLFRELYKDNKFLGEKLLEFYKLNKDTKLYFDKKIFNNAKLQIDNSVFLYMPSNEKTITLKNIQPAFLTNNIALYYNYLEKYKEYVLKNENDFDIFTDKNQTVKISFTKEKNERIVNELKEQAMLKKYDYFIRGDELRNIDIQEFSGLTFSEQAKLIFKLISTFSRKNSFRKSKTVVLEDTKYIIFDSFTGLYSTKIDLDKWLLEQ